MQSNLYASTAAQYAPQQQQQQQQQAQTNEYHQQHAEQQQQYIQQQQAQYVPQQQFAQQQYVPQPQQQQQQYGQAAQQQQQPWAPQVSPQQQAPAAQHQPQQYGQQQQQQQQQPANFSPPKQFSADPSLEAICATDSNGLRWTWSTYPNGVRPKQPIVPNPNNAYELPTDMVVPLACMYTPLHVAADCTLPVVDELPVLCKKCGAAWSCHSRLDQQAGHWGCRSCLARNPLPQNFNPQHPSLSAATVEYRLGVDQSAVPIFVFVVDTCLIYEELEALKKNLARCVEWLPPRALVGFISFGHGVTLWELGFQEISKCYALRGTRSYQRNELVSMLGISDEAPVLGRFLVPLEECEFVLSSIIEDLAADPFPVPSGCRPQRATGTALDAAVTLLECAGATQICGDIILLTGGPCTRGPGTVVGTALAEMMRFHRNLLDGSATHYEAATAYYRSLETRLSSSSLCLDVFAACLDQIGVMEFGRCVSNTGGVMVCGDTFDHKMFQESLKRFFERLDTKRAMSPSSTARADEAPKCGSGTVIQIFTSSETLVCGAIGPICDPSASAAPSSSSSSGIGGFLSSSTSPPASPAATSSSSQVGTSLQRDMLAKKGSTNHPVGISGTTRWTVSRLDSSMTLTILFDTETADGAAETTGQRFFQFSTEYTTSTGERRLRVTSVTHHVAPTKDPQYFVMQKAFDQACAATVVSRLAVCHLEQHATKWESTKRWVDRLLVLFSKRFGTFTVGNPDSLRLAPGFSMFPSFMFHFRRSEYFMVLNISPDETTFKRHWMMRENTDSCVLMIQPTLDAYSTEAPFATPVLLDSTSIKPDNALLMDAFFNIHILWGASTFAWMNAKYHEIPEYAHFKAMLEAPEKDAQLLLSQRFPFPRFSRTDVDGSEARHVKTRMNPSTTHNTTQNTGESIMYTDEASISRFMQTLKAAVVAPEQPN